MKPKPGEDTPFYAGVYLWWRKNPTKPEMCIVLENNKRGFKLLMMSNFTIVDNCKYESEEFETPTDEEVEMFWQTNLISDARYFEKIMLDHGISLPPAKVH